MISNDLRRTPALAISALRHLSSLMQGEMRLARAELSHNLSRAGVGVAFFGIAAILALVALNVLAGALVAYIAAQGLSAGAAALIVGAVFLAAAAILVFAGRARLSADALAPSRTAENIQKDIQKVSEATNV